MNSQLQFQSAERGSTVIPGGSLLESSGSGGQRGQGKQTAALLLGEVLCWGSDLLLMHPPGSIRLLCCSSQRLAKQGGATHALV